MKPIEKRVTIAYLCPWHGVLRTPVEYFNVDIGSKKLVDMSVKFCQDCGAYYTPFLSYLASKKIIHKGYPVSAGMGGVYTGKHKENVRLPYYVDANVNIPPRTEDSSEKYRKYIDSLRKVVYVDITMTNNSLYIKNHSCPKCQTPTKKETIKIMDLKGGKYAIAKVRHCSQCNLDFITPSQFHGIHWKIKKLFCSYYTRFRNIECKSQSNGKYLFIPIWALDIDKYDHHHLPPKSDTFYDMTDEEYLWVKLFYQPEEFQAQLRPKSFLGEAGYSTSETEIRRHNILEKCANEYGKDRVIYQLKSNMNMRLRQKDGNIRYAHALNIWRGDIWYVENKL